MNSVWSATTAMPEFDSLKKDMKTDVLIIGGGITGILCAYLLKEAGVNCALVEARRICSGITKNTTAKITSQHGLIYSRLIREFGVEKARMYLEANEAALQKYRELCSDIPCKFENKSAFVYTLSNRRKITDELKALEKIGFAAEFSEDLPLPFTVYGAVKFNNQAQFNPLAFIKAIVPGMQIFENTPVRELVKTTAVTDGGRIYADKIICSTHFPFINKHGGYFIKMYQHRSYVTALENAADVDGMYVDESKTGMSFRNYKNLLLLGGGGHRTGKQGGGWNELQRFAQWQYPQATERYRWATQDCETLDGVPYIGRYSNGSSDFFVATGYNKWGMTSAMVAATLLCDMVRDRENRYAPVFSPSRTVMRAQLFINAFESASGLLTVSKKRCPHLGCVLKWNEQERSWDCPCHGSRFTCDGKLIDNPATGDLPDGR